MPTHFLSEPQAEKAGSSTPPSHSLRSGRNDKLLWEQKQLERERVARRRATGPGFPGFNLRPQA